MIIKKYSARKNPEVNTKQSAKERLKYYANRSDSKDIFISYIGTLADIPKIGINPVSNFETPLGVYTYQIDQYWEQIGRSLGDVPFQGGMPYIAVLKLKKDLKFIDDMKDYSQAELFSDVAKLRSMFVPEMLDISQWDEIIDYSVKHAKDKSPIMTFWYLTRVLSYINKEIKGKKNKDEVIMSLLDRFQDIQLKSFPFDGHKGKGLNIHSLEWNKLLRSLGYVGFGDRSGKSYIHENEPVQAVFLQPTAYDVLEILKNKEQSLDFLNKINDDDNFRKINPEKLNEAHQTITKVLEKGYSLTPQKNRWIEYLLETGRAPKEWTDTIEKNFLQNNQNSPATNKWISEKLKSDKSWQEIAENKILQGTFPPDWATDFISNKMNVDIENLDPKWKDVISQSILVNGIPPHWAAEFCLKSLYSKKAPKEWIEGITKYIETYGAPPYWVENWINDYVKDNGVPPRWAKGIDKFIAGSGRCPDWAENWCKGKLMSNDPNDVPEVWIQGISEYMDNNDRAPVWAEDWITRELKAGRIRPEWKELIDVAVRDTGHLPSWAKAWGHDPKNKMTEISKDWIEGLVRAKGSLPLWAIDYVEREIKNENSILWDFIISDWKETAIFPKWALNDVLKELESGNSGVLNKKIFDAINTVVTTKNIFADQLGSWFRQKIEAKEFSQEWMHSLFECIKYLGVIPLFAEEFFKENFNIYKNNLIDSLFHEDCELRTGEIIPFWLSVNIKNMYNNSPADIPDKINKFVDRHISRLGDVPSIIPMDYCLNILKESKPPNWIKGIKSYISISRAIPYWIQPLIKNGIETNEPLAVEIVAFFIELYGRIPNISGVFDAITAQFKGNNPHPMYQQALEVFVASHLFPPEWAEEWWEKTHPVKTASNWVDYLVKIGKY